MKYNLHCGDVSGDVLPPPHGTNASCNVYDKRDDFYFGIVNFPYLDGDVPRRAPYGVYVSQLIRFARVSSHVTDFNTRNNL